MKIFNKGLSIGGEAEVSGTENVLLFKNMCVCGEFANIWPLWEVVGSHPSVSPPQLSFDSFSSGAGDYRRVLTQGVRAGGK